MMKSNQWSLAVLWIAAALLFPSVKCYDNYGTKSSTKNTPSDGDPTRSPFSGGSGYSPLSGGGIGRQHNYDPNPSPPALVGTDDYFPPSYAATPYPDPTPDPPPSDGYTDYSPPTSSQSGGGGRYSYSPPSSHTIPTPRINPGSGTPLIPGISAPSPPVW